MFVNSYGVWKLAGINYSVEGPFSKTSTGSTFLGAIYDKGGLYQNGSLISDGSTDLPAAAYATRISARQSWINSVLSGQLGSSGFGTTVPEPASAALLVIGAACGLLRRRRAT